MTEQEMGWVQVGTYWALLELGYASQQRRSKQIKAGPSPYMTAEEVAAYLRLPTLAALYSLVQRGRLNPLPGHRRYRFTEKELKRYLEGRK